MGHIVAKDLVVEFPVYANSHRSIKNTLISASTGGRLAKTASSKVKVRAVDKVSFELKRGDRLGILGHNGSGKTTLLRVLAGAYEPISGYLKRSGRVASLLDISMGMDQDATGYENIFLRGIMMGLSPSEIESKTEEIAEFSDLGDFLNMPIRTYSSGMKVRLAFAVSTCVDADILIMDEWLSVGDADFSEKAAARLNELVEKSAILIIATHSPALLAKVCNRAFRMEHGRIIEEFDPLISAK